MSKYIRPGELGAALKQALTLYSQEVNDEIDQAVSDSMRKLVRITRATAPVGARGSFRRNITATYQTLNRRGGGGGIRGLTHRATWYVKAPDHRLTHLIVHGHATKDGGRTRSDPFLQNALDQVLPEYEQRVKEAIRG